MDKGFFPPYFVEVSLAWALGVMPLACGLTAWSARTPTGAPEAQVATKQVRGFAAPEAEPDPPKTRVVHIDGLQHDIEVEESLLTTEELEVGLSRFAKTVSSVEESGRSIGVLIYDLGTKEEVSYAADERFYPASSVKGPYVISVFEEMVDSGLITTSEVAHLAEPTIVKSDNDTYRAMRNLCGSQVFADWAVSCGAIEQGSEDYRQFSNLYYPIMSPRQMAQMWQHAFVYLSSESDSAEELLELFERREESPMRAGLADEDLTITKAGWYPSDSGEEYEATAEAGIVFEDGYAYVVVIMTNIPDNLARLEELVPGIWSATNVLK